jgi:hypothetical protein
MSFLRRGKQKLLPIAKLKLLHLPQNAPQLPNLPQQRVALQGVLALAAVVV